MAERKSQSDPPGVADDSGDKEVKDLRLDTVRNPGLKPKRFSGGRWSFSELAVLGSS